MSGERAFYDLMHEGQRLILPRVTTILSVLNKPALMWWAANREREAIKSLLMDALTAPQSFDGNVAEFVQRIWDRIESGLAGRRAWVQDRDAAANIGTEAHTVIQWHTRKMLGLDVGPEPGASDASMRAVLAWLDWAQDVAFAPYLCEKVVYCPQCAYAGTVDCVGKVSGRVTAIDYKTGKAVYPEAFFQVAAYRHGLSSAGIDTDAALILRLPKIATDPAFEEVYAPYVSLADWRAICQTWRAMRALKDEEVGNVTMEECRG